VFHALDRLADDANERVERRVTYARHSRLNHKRDDVLASHGDDVARDPLPVEVAAAGQGAATLGKLLLSVPAAENESGELPSWKQVST